MSDTDVNSLDAHSQPPGKAVETVFLPVARSRALVRAVLLGVAAALLGLTAAMIYRRMDFTAPGVSGRVVDASLAVVLLSFGVATMLVGFHAARWFLLAVWPAPVGVTASPARLELRLGPFGTRCFDAVELVVRYPYELSADEAERAFEAFLPEEEQRANFLPQMKHASAAEPLNRTLLRFVGASEPEVAGALRTMVEVWRSSVPPQTEGIG